MTKPVSASSLGNDESTQPEPDKALAQEILQEFNQFYTIMHHKLFPNDKKIQLGTDQSVNQDAGKFSEKGLQNIINASPIHTDEKWAMFEKLSDINNLFKKTDTQNLDGNNPQMQKLLKFIKENKPKYTLRGKIEKITKPLSSVAQKISHKVTKSVQSKTPDNTPECTQSGLKR